MRSTVLLDLPDEPLSQVFCYLRPSNQVFSRFFDHGKDALSLATCNKRLFHLFVQTLCIISASPSVPLTILDLPRNTLSIEKFAKLIRLAGQYLRVLHLPFYFNCNVATLLHLTAIHCPNLEEISYPSNIVTTADEQFFHFRSSVKRLHVSNPGTVLNLMARLPFLEELCIVHMNPEVRITLQALLLQNGHRLRKLAVGFAVSADKDVIVNVSREELELCRFMVRHQKRNMPLLETLEVKAELPDHLVSDPEFLAAMGHDSHNDLYLRQVTSIVQRARAEISEDLGGSLRRVLISNGFALRLRPLQILLPLISLHTTVEVETLNMHIVISEEVDTCQGHGTTVAQLKSLELNRSTFRFLEHPEILSGLESLCIMGGEAFHNQLIVEDAISPALNEIVRRSNGTLKHLREALYMGRKDDHISSFLCMTRLLDVAPNICFLELTFRTMQFIFLERDGVAADVRPRMRSLRHLKVLALNGNPRGVFPMRRYHKNYQLFVHSLPFFLEFVGDECTSLQTLYLTGLGKDTLYGCVDSEMELLVCEALNAVEKLYRKRNCLDAQTIKAQLEHWRELHRSRNALHPLPGQNT